MIQSPARAASFARLRSLGRLVSSQKITDIAARIPWQLGGMAIYGITTQGSGVAVAGERVLLLTDAYPGIPKDVLMDFRQLQIELHHLSQSLDAQ